MPAMRQHRRRTFGGGTGGDGPGAAGRVPAAGIPGAATAPSGVPIATAVNGVPDATAVNGVPDATAGIGVPDATAGIGVPDATGPGLSFASATTPTPTAAGVSERTAAGAAAWILRAAPPHQQVVRQLG